MLLGNFRDKPLRKTIEKCVNFMHFCCFIHVSDVLERWIEKVGFIRAPSDPLRLRAYSIQVIGILFRLYHVNNVAYMYMYVKLQSVSQSSRYCSFSYTCASSTKKIQSLYFSFPLYVNVFWNLGKILLCICLIRYINIIIIFSWSWDSEWLILYMP